MKKPNEMPIKSQMGRMRDSSARLPIQRITGNRKMSAEYTGAHDGKYGEASGEALRRFGDAGRIYRAYNRGSAGKQQPVQHEALDKARLKAAHRLLALLQGHM